MTERIRWQSMRPNEIDLRDSIAKDTMTAMIQGLLSSSPNSLASADMASFARIAYAVADAMMVERLK